jgi:hypothetical protein
MNYYGVLERSKTEMQKKRADFFCEAFGGMHVKLLDDEVTILVPPGAKERKPFFKAAVFATKQAEMWFAHACVIRVNGERTLLLARELGFYPVNVDGITLVSSETPIFGVSQNEAH